MPDLDVLRSLIVAGGWVMWPLLVLSVVSVALTAERAWFWLRLGGAADRADPIAAGLRAGRFRETAKSLRRDRSVYAVFARELAAEGAERPVTESFALGAAEGLRPSVERWAAVHSAIITAAPMLGILGTVTGIIRSFRLIGGSDAVTDPVAVAGGIAEALFTTAFGLVVAIATLLPHAIFRAQADRCLGTLEVLGAAAIEGSARRDLQASS